MKDIELRDTLVSLKPMHVEDAEAHLAGEDEEQIRWIAGGKGTLERTQNWIRKNLEYWDNNGPVFTFGIWSLETGKLSGMVEANLDFEKIEGMLPGDANISYGVYPEARGKGYAVAAVNLVTDFLKQKNVRRAVLRILPRNDNSLRIPAACGFAQQGEIETKEGKMLFFQKPIGSSSARSDWNDHN